MTVNCYPIIDAQLNKICSLSLQAGGAQNQRGRRTSGDPPPSDRVNPLQRLTPDGELLPLNFLVRSGPSRSLAGGPPQESQQDSRPARYASAPVMPAFSAQLEADEWGQDSTPVDAPTRAPGDGDRARSVHGGSVSGGRRAPAAAASRMRSGWDEGGNTRRGSGPAAAMKGPNVGEFSVPPVPEYLEPPPGPTVRLLKSEPVEVEAPAPANPTPSVGPGGLRRGCGVPGMAGMAPPGDHVDLWVQKVRPLSNSSIL